MALVVESYSSGTATTSNNVTVTKPTGVAVGDLLLIIGNSTQSSWSCTGFTLGNTFLYEGPGTIDDCEIKTLYRIADSSDVSASNYTITGSTSNNGVVAMFRISGWTSGNPVYQSPSTGWAPTTSGTLTVSGLSIPRSGQNVLIMIGSSYNSADSDYIGAFTSYTVTSGESNPTWTEVVDTSVDTGSGGTGKKSLGVAYTSTTNTSTITAFSFDYTEYNATDKAGALGILLVLNEPVSPTTDLSHNAITPAFFGPTVTQVNTAPDLSHLDTQPTVHGAEAEALAPDVWTTIPKS